MARVCFSKGKQNEFLKKAKAYLGGTWDKVADVCKVHPRTVRDWAREKYQISHEAVIRLSEVTKNAIPRRIKILPEYWSTKKASYMGGRRYVELYGSPGTLEGRRKGGLTAIRKMRSLGPEYAVKIGFKQRKKISYPRHSAELAEFIGIFLGDGGIRSRFQATISFNKKADKEFSKYCQGLIKKLFHIDSAINSNKQDNGADIVISSRNLVEFLRKHGIKEGNKVKYGINVPAWIAKNRQFIINCLRGLMDTDGCIYVHKYYVNGKLYQYRKLCFSSCSYPLLCSVTEMFRNLDFNPRMSKDKKKLYVDEDSEVNRYFREIGTKNPRYFHRYLGKT